MRIRLWVGIVAFVHNFFEDFCGINAIAITLVMSKKLERESITTFETRANSILTSNKYDVRSKAVG
jgi:hypothetical protein